MAYSTHLSRMLMSINSILHPSFESALFMNGMLCVSVFWMSLTCPFPGCLSHQQRCHCACYVNLPGMSEWSFLPSSTCQSLSSCHVSHRPTAVVTSKSTSFNLGRSCNKEHTLAYQRCAINHLGIGLVSQQPGKNIARVLHGFVWNVSWNQAVEAILWCQGPGNGCPRQRAATRCSYTISEE